MFKKPIQFAAIGECMIELQHTSADTLKLAFAGDTFNVTLYLARYRDQLNLNVSYLTALGDDPYSNMMLANWQQEGIHTKLIPQLPQQLPGLYLINTDREGERHFYYYRAQSAARKLFYAPQIANVIEQLMHFDYLYISGISLAILDESSRVQLINLLKQAKQQGAVIGFDTNYRPILWENIANAKSVINHALQQTTIAMVSFEDEQRLFADASPEQCAERLHRHGIKEVVVRLGKQGCLLSFKGITLNIPAPTVTKVVDTTGAGDSFNAAYLAARIKGWEPDKAVMAGFQLASTVIAYPGAIIPVAAMPHILAED